MAIQWNSCERESLTRFKDLVEQIYLLADWTDIFTSIELLELSLKIYVEFKILYPFGDYQLYHHNSEMLSWALILIKP